MGFSTDNPASADAIRASESRLVKRAERRQSGFGDSWELVMRIADRIRTGAWRPELRRLEAMWRDASTPTVSQAADAATKKYQAGIVPKRQTREDLRYNAEQIALMEQEDDEEQARQTAAMTGDMPPPRSQPAGQPGAQPPTGVPAGV
jgi:hypothetical protein